MRNLSVKEAKNLRYWITGNEVSIKIGDTIRLDRINPVVDSCMVTIYNEEELKELLKYPGS